jgi:hypothetical protein
MTSKDVAQLLIDLRITRSHSRPHVSNDNAFSDYAEREVMPKGWPSGGVVAARSGFAG